MSPSITVPPKYNNLPLTAVLDGVWNYGISRVFVWAVVHSHSSLVKRLLELPLGAELANMGVSDQNAIRMILGVCTLLRQKKSTLKSDSDL